MNPLAECPNLQAGNTHVRTSDVPTRTGHDRHTIALSAEQIALAEAVFGANKNAVLVLVNGGMISIDELRETAPAILEVCMCTRVGSTHPFTPHTPSLATLRSWL